MSAAHEPATRRATDGSEFVHALALGLDPAWRRVSDDVRHADGAAFCTAVGGAANDGVRTYTYSMVGLQPGVELLIWRLGSSMEALEAAAALAMRSGVGRWMSVRESFVGRVGPSQYVAKPTGQEQSLFTGDRSRYLIVYPFTKSTDWYLLSRETRQGVMNEHMRVGHQYPMVRQLLAYSFGLDDQEYIVAYETDDLAAFGDLVRALRATESRRSTVRDTPILLGIHRPIEAITELLGAP